MPDGRFKFCLKSPLLHGAQPDPGHSTSSPFPTLPSADLGTFPLAEFRSFPAWVAFAFRARFPGGPLGLAWPGEAPGAVGEERDKRTGVGGRAGFPSYPD